MRKIAHIAGSIALIASFNVGTVTTASANNIRDYCRAVVDAGFVETMGQCQSAINKSRVDFCREYSDFFGFKNQGECVKTLRASLNDFKKA